MFSFAMTSGLASDFDEFEIIITLRRVRKFRDTGPYKNLICCLLSVPLGEQASGKEVGLLRPGPRDPKVFRLQMVR